MAEAIRFLLGDAERTLATVPPTLTVLDYLRRTERRMGTKEGCAEGDCGACTVVLCEPDGRGGLTLRAVNSCIQFVGTLHGRQLVTVEDLAGPEGQLHPVQRALVDHHGSQCGFCTPGFVMQLYAGAAAGRVKTRTEVKDWIAGNLCRCTGYGPIIEAGLVSAASGPDRAEDKAVAARLAALDDKEMLVVAHEGRRYLAPRSADDLATLCLAYPDAVLVAGATDVGLWVTKQRREMKTLIDISRIAELARLTDTKAGLTIGATVTLADAHAALARLHPDLGELMRRFAGQQIRAAGTVGGNIANGSPIGDLAPALIALGARLTLRRGDRRREIPLEDFFVAYGKQDRTESEFVEKVFIPRPAPDTRFACYKLSKRFDSDISAVMAAFAVTVRNGIVKEARLAFGGMAGIPKRATAAEKALTGKAFSSSAIELAAEALDNDYRPLTDMRASAPYRLTAAKNLLRRFGLERAAGATTPTRLLELADG